MISQFILTLNDTIASKTVLLCNARDLHAFLGVKKMFAAWITNRISEYRFTENQDYILFPSLGKQTSGGGGHSRKDYHLTLDTAKGLATVERNERGRQMCRYFVECEKRFRSMQPAQQLTDEEIILLCCMQVQVENAQNICELLYPVTKELSSSYASKLYDIMFETFYAVTKSRDVSFREATRLDQTSAVFERVKPMLKSLRARQFES